METGDASLYIALAPFVAAALAPFLVRVLGARAAWILALVPAAMFVHFAGLVPIVSAGTALTPAVDWIPSLGVRYAMLIDGLSLLFALLVTGIGALIVVYAGGYLSGHPRLGRFLSFILLFMGAMLGLVLADDLLSLLVLWELTSITSFLLIGFDHAREASRRAALQALLVTGGGGLALMAGLILAGIAGGTTSLSGLLALPDGLRGHALYLPVFLLVLAGAFTKSAQFPLHFWLPNAMEAPTPVSAYLHSATMVKAGVYLLMRLEPVLGGTPEWTSVLPLFGGVTLVAGGLLAVRQTDLKLMLAYTTMASLGLLVLLTGTSDPRALQGAALYLVAHALFKGALFMVVGAVDHEAGTRDVTRLRGLRRAMPVTFAAALVAGLSMAGLPPLLGFVAKEVLYDGLASSGAAFATAAAVAGNALMFAIAGAVALKPFLGGRVETPREAAGAHVHEAPPSLWLGPAVLAALGLVLALTLGWTGDRLIAPVVTAVVGAPVALELHLLPAYVNAALLLTLLTVALGALVYWKLDAVRTAVAGVLAAIGWGPDRGFDQAVRGLVRLAVALRPVTQPGRLEIYLNIAFVAVAAALLLPWLGPAAAVMPVPEMPPFHVAAVMAIAVAGLYAVLVAESRLVAIVALGIQGFAVAVLFMLFGAPDLSLTQFMVETLSVVILALAMTRLQLSPSDRRPWWESVPELILAIAVGAGFTLILTAVTARPFDSRLSDFFTENSRAIAHGRNIVNVIIVDFRGLDTLGEITVVMVTGLAVMVLIGMRVRRKREARP